MQWERKNSNQLEYVWTVERTKERSACLSPFNGRSECLLFHFDAACYPCPPKQRLGGTNSMKFHISYFLSIHVGDGASAARHDLRLGYGSDTSTRMQAKQGLIWLQRERKETMATTFFPSLQCHSQCQHIYKLFAIATSFLFKVNHGINCRKQ